MKKFGLQTAFIFAVSLGFTSLTLNAEELNLTALDSARIREEVELNDNLVKSIYNVQADADGIDYIDADTSRVDFTTPGRYTITFTAYDVYGMNSEEYYSIIEVTDVLPTIDTDIDQVEVEAGTEIDIEDIFGVHVGGDYTEVTIDDSNVDYGVEGNYEVIITAVDDEDNVVTKTVIITVTITQSEGCLNNGGHTNNSHNCQDEDAICNNNGSNDCLNENNGTNGNANSNADKNNNGNGKN